MRLMSNPSPATKGSSRDAEWNPANIETVDFWCQSSLGLVEKFIVNGCLLGFPGVRSDLYVEEATLSVWIG